MKLLPLLRTTNLLLICFVLVVGCAASGSELRFGVGRSLGSGGGTVTSNLDRSVDEGWQVTNSSANTTTSLRDQDSTSGWVELMVPLGPKQIEIVNPGLGVMPSVGRTDSVSTDVTTPPETPKDAALSDSGGIPNEVWLALTGLLLVVATWFRQQIAAGAKKVLPKRKRREVPNAPRQTSGRSQAEEEAEEG